MDNLSVLDGQIPLGIVPIVRPLATINIYQYAVMLRKVNEQGATSEYPVSPSALALALGATVKFETGLLEGNTVYVGQHGNTRVIVEYYPPQMAGLFLEGSEKALRLPLPGLLMQRTVHAEKNPNYRIYAVKRKPQHNDDPLYMAPLPNVNPDGTCWGTVPRPVNLSGTSLADDWKLFMGSRFGNHSTGGKSKRFKDDIRKLLLELDAEKAKKYPLTDLQTVGKQKVKSLFMLKD